MPSTIESRIVSMVFDNKAFEKNVATSMDTLDGLNKKLEFKDADKNFKNLEGASSKVTFSSMRSSIEDIGVKLKASTIIGMEVLKNLTNSAIDFAKTWAKKVIDPITSGGWNRATAIDQAKFKLEGLGITWEDIASDIDYGVKDTAYGLGSAASAAAQFAASGVKLGDDMKTALRSISGVAAMTSSSYDDIANIFTGIAGANRLYGDDLNSLATRGLNAAAVLADALGTTQQNIRDMVSKGEIDFATFAKAMDNAYGEHAKKGNETFEGSLDNMKSALGRIGAEFATSFRANMIPVWNALRVTFNDVKAQMGPVFEVADAIMTDLSERVSRFIKNIDELVVKGGAFSTIFAGVADLAEAAYEVLITIADTVADIFDSFSTYIPDIEWAHEVMVDFMDPELAKDSVSAWKQLNFKTLVQPFADMAAHVKEVVQSEEFIDKLVKGVRTVFEIFSTIGTIIKNVISDIKSWVWYFTEGFKYGSSDYLKSLFSIQTVLGYIRDVLKKIAEFHESEGFQIFAQKTEGVVSKLGRAIGGLLTDIQNFGLAFTEAWKKVFPMKYFSEAESFFGSFYGKFQGMISQALNRFGFSEDIYESQVRIFEKLFKVLDVGKKIFNTIAQAVGVVIVNVVNLAAAMREAFYDTFTGTGVSDFATRLNQLIYSIQNFVSKLVFSETAIDNFKRAFAGIFSLISIIKDIFEATFSVISRVVVNVMGDVTRNTEGAIDGVTGFIGKLGDWLVKLREWIDEHDAINRVADAVYNLIAKTINFFRNLVEWIHIAWDKLNEWVEKVTGSSIKEHFDNIGIAAQNAWEKIKNFFSNLAHGKEAADGEEKVNRFSSIWEKIKIAVGKAHDAFEKAWPFISDKLGKMIDMIGDIFSGLGGLFGGGSLSVEGADLKGVGVLLGGIGALKLGTGSQGALTAFSDAFSSLTDTLKMAQDKLKIDTVQAIAKSIVMIAASVVALALIDSEKLLYAVGALEGIILEFKQFAVMISQLASDMGKSGIKDFKKTAGAMIELAAALLIISVAVDKLGTMDAFDLAKGLAAVYIIIKELAIAVESFSKHEKSVVGTCAAMILLALALDLLVIPVKQLGKMDAKDLAKGLGAVGGLLLELAIAMKLFAGNRITDLMGAASAILLLSTAMLLLVVPMKVFGSMEWDAIGKGLVAIGALLLEFVIATKMMSGGGAMMAALTVTALSVAMLLLIAPMEAFAHMEWQQIAKGLVAVGGLLLEFVLVTKLLKGGSALGAAITVIALAVALNALILPLKAFGSMSWAEIGKGLLVIAGALGVFIVAGYLAAPVAVIILALGAALLMLGAAVALAGAGLMEMALAFSLMTALGPGLGDTIKTVFGALISLIPTFVSAVMEGLNILLAGIFTLIETLIVGIFTMLPQIVSGVLGLLGNILDAVVAFLPKLLQHFPTIVEAFFFMLKTIVQKFAEVAPELFDALGKILRNFLQMLNDVAPDFWAFVATTLLGIILVIKATAPDLIETVFEIIVKLLEELAKNMADIVNLVINTIITLLEVLTQRLPELSLAVVEFVISLINSVADTLMQKAPEIRDAIAKLLGSIIKLVLEIFGFDTSNMDNNEFTKIGGFLMGGFVGGLVDKFPEFWDKIKEFFKKIGDWFKTKFNEFKDFGKRLLEGLRDGVKEKFEEVKDKIVGFFSKIGEGIKNLFGIHSPSTMFKEFGKQIMLGFQQGADNEHEGLVSKVKGFFGKVGDGVKDLFGIDKEDSMFAGFGKKIVGAFKNAVSDSSGDAESEVTGVFGKVTEAAASSESSFVEIGIRLMGSLNQGLAKGLPTSLDTVSKVMESTVAHADSYYGSFYNIGVNMVNGLSNGMKANKPIANRSAQDMANELATIARQTLGIRSPSRVFAEIGKYVDIGMANGILQYTDLVNNAGVDVADVAVNSVSQAIAAISDSFVTDIGGDPVIRPVLDLTEIENGTSRIANMFGDPTLTSANPLFMGGYIDQTVGGIKMDSGFGVNSTSNTTNNNAAINISVNAAPGQNAEAIADAVQKRLKMSLDQRGYAFR